MKNRLNRTSRTCGSLALAGTLALLSGCAHVKPEELASSMDQLREEMRTQDQAVEDRLGDRMDQMQAENDQRLSALESDLGSLRDDFQVTVERLESAIRFNAPVHFAFDDASIRTEDRDVLDRFAQVVANYYDQAIITVEGFADPSGSAQYNLQLGERRADAVKDYLESAGIPSDRLRAVSYGEATDRQVVPDAQGPGDAGWQNRRVSMVIDFNQGSEGTEGTPIALNETGGA